MKRQALYTSGIGGKTIPCGIYKLEFVGVQPLIVMSKRKLFNKLRCLASKRIDILRFEIIMAIIVLFSKMELVYFNVPRRLQGTTTAVVNSNCETCLVLSHVFKSD